MQLFQINQSEDSCKITIKFNNTCIQLHQRSVLSAFNYNRTYSIPPNCRGDGPALGARVAALQPLPHPLRLRAEAGEPAPGRGGALQAAQPQRAAGPREHQQVLVA